MIRELKIKVNSDFVGCDNCVHADDTEAICKLRCCVYAVSRHIKDCYEPKGSEGNNGHYQVD